MTFLELKKYMISELLSEYNRLKEIGEIKDPELFSPTADIAVVLRDIFSLSRTEYLISRDFEVSEAQYNSAIKALEELKALKPVQYITGSCEFMSLEFAVNESTLIPRADTETLVEYILSKHEISANIKILDIGTGSGCIAISLAHYLKNSEVTAIDISDRALETARQNAKANNVSDRITFLKHDILSSFIPGEFEFDCIVSNPPYIETSVIEGLEKNVTDYEPLSALDGGEDGLDFYRTIIDNCRLKSDGILAFEIGYNQGRALLELFELSGKFKNAEIVKDLGGNDRVAAAIFTI